MNYALTKHKMGTMTRTGILVLAAMLVGACGGNGNSDGENNPIANAGPSGTVNAPTPVCTAASSGGGTAVSTPELIASFSDRWHEAWQASPVVADLDGDGNMEILSARSGLILGWHMDGSIVFMAEVEDRIWASPVVADLIAANPGLEVAAAAWDKLYLWDSGGQLLPGFPFTWRDKMRSLAAGDINADGALELVAVTTQRLQGGEQRDIIIAVNNNGTVVDGFPPNTTGRPVATISAT